MGTTGPHALLGNLLINHGLITEAVLLDALEKQRTCLAPLGEILTKQGSITQQELEMMLRAQSRLRGKPGNLRSHILIVDDDPEVGAVVGEILAGAGYSVGVAQNGQEALAALASEDTLTPALIVLDLNMPDTNGLDLLPILRQAVTRPIPVVILTGHAEVETQARAMRMGVQEFLIKPAPARKLVSVVDAVLAASPASYA